MHKSIFRFGFAVMLSVLCLNVLSFGQSTLGAVSGTITDSTGAAVPGAQVTLTNIGTGAKFTSVTSSQGIYNFRNLAVGSYSVSALASGFSVQEKSGLQLFANQTLTADLVMNVAGVQSTIQVNAGNVVLDTHNSELSDVITGPALLDMPVLSRQGGATGIVSDLFYMPGAQNPNSNSIANGTGDSSGYPPIDGARQLDTMVTMDGMIVMSNVGDEGAGPVQPSEEAIQEIHTVLADAPAEFWRSAAVTVVSKSGTNRVHGTLFEDYNGSALNTRSYFAQSVPFRVENNFAVSLGGPIKKDKLFYFGDYEGGRNVGRSVVVANVPTTAERAGDFSGLAYKIVNPYTGQPFQNNVIPQNLISPVAQALQSALYPIPNYGNPTLQSGNYRNLFPSVIGWNDFDDADGSLLYNPSDKDAIFGRMSYRNLPRNAFRSNNLPAVGRITESRIGDNGVITENHVFSPAVVNELRFGYTDMQLSYNIVFDEAALLQKAGLQGPFTSASIPEAPALTITSMTASNGVPDTIDNQKDVEWNDNLSWTRGKHLLKVGIDQIIDQTREKSVSNKIYGAYTFNGKFTGNGYADFLLGIPQQTAVTSPGPTTSLRGIMLGAYAQDQYQLNQRLTVNYGLRWEYQGPYSGASALMYSFDPKNGAEVVETQAALTQLSPYFPSNLIPVETAAQAGYPSGSLLFSHHLNFYPRAGFAYRLFPDARTVIRGAYGMYGNNIYAAAGTGQLFNGGPFTGSATFRNSFVNGTPLFSFPKPFLSSGTVGTQTASANDPHITIPFTQQWTLAIEQQIASSAILTVSYVGAASRNLLETVNLNQPRPSTIPFSAAELPYPNYQAVNWTQNGGVDNYNSLQISVRKNNGKNLSLDTGLTIARDLTDTQDIGSYNGQPPENRFCIGCDYGNNGLTRRYDYFLNASYKLPVGRGQRFGSNANGLLDTVIGGWSIAMTGSVFSGPFFTPMINSGYDTANTNTSFSQRPDQIGDPYVSSKGISHWFNVNAFAIPGCPASDPLCKNTTPANVGRFGNVKPGTLVGPNYVSFDASVAKMFHVRGESTFELRLTAQNALNHPNFEIPDWNITDGPGVAGVVTSLSAADVGPREVDIIGRLRF